MKPRDKERMEELLRQGALARQDLSQTVLEIRGEIEKRRARWKMASVVATGLATGATVAYKLFGKSSIAARVGKAASAASVLVGLTRAAMRMRRFR